MNENFLKAIYARPLIYVNRKGSRVPAGGTFIRGGKGVDRPLQIVFRNTGHPAFLAGHIRERVQHLERFYSHIIGCRVVVEAAHRSFVAARKPLIISVEIEVPGRPKIVARSEAVRQGAKRASSAALNQVFEAVQRKLEELAKILKGRVKKHEGAVETGVVARIFPEENDGFVDVKGAPDLDFPRNGLVKGDFDDLEAGAMVRVTRAGMEGPIGPRASSVRVIERGNPGRRKAHPSESKEVRPERV